ncbi:hypothetical protein NC653_006468 [Populus alba x Populus x berolinensis]|uniref:Uncharacterized protein n=1 Tax=Populus alba x Populus x berolinensis TaxID=444605 RepID=A0AAD6REC5_9ROSI|nr:hypothetical protein NC653_006468 [Populus alba x Populus x berolinensis]
MGTVLLCMGCCVWVCSVWFMGKIKGLWFSMDGLPSEEIGKETDPKGGFGLLWFHGLPSHGFRFIEYGSFWFSEINREWELMVAVKYPAYK